MPPSPFHQYHEERGSPAYDEISKRYADAWELHAPDEDHYENVRTATMAFYREQLKRGVRAEDTSCVILGPGFNVADYRDLDPPFVRTEMAEHGGMLIVDFSRKVLQNAAASLNRASRRRLEPKIALARKDLSGGRTAKLDAYILDRFDHVGTAGELEELMRWLQDTDQVIEDVGRQPVPMGKTRHLDTSVISVQEGRMCDFQSILDEEAPKVRFVISNLLLAGLFAATESIAREKILEIDERETLGIDRLRAYFDIWHQIICRLNTEASIQLIRQLFESNPDATLSAVVDTTSIYMGKDNYVRWPFAEIRSSLARYDVVAHQLDAWQLDDSAEKPPHKHDIGHFVFSKAPPRAVTSLVKLSLPVVPNPESGQPRPDTPTAS